MFDQLVKELFIGDIKTIRQLMRDQTESDRTNLYQQFEPLIAALYRALWDQKKADDSTFDRWIIRNYDLNFLYHSYLDDPTGFIEKDLKQILPNFNIKEQMNQIPAQIEEYFRTAHPANADYLININSMNHEFYVTYETYITLFIHRIRALEVGLANQRAVETALKKKDHTVYNYRHLWFIESSLAPEEQFVYYLGAMLLDRDVSWRQSLFFKLCEKITIWRDRFCTGFADLLIEAINRFPQWQMDLSKYYDKAMIYDGFRQERWSKEYPQEMIIAGLTTRQFASQDHLSAFRSAPITHGNIFAELIRMLQQDRSLRPQYIELAMREILSPQKPAVLSSWCNLLESMALTSLEYEQHRYSFIDLTQAQASEVVQLGITGLTQLWNMRLLTATEIISAVKFALNNQAQVTANKSLQLMKRIVKESNYDIDQIIPSLIDALTSPHKQFRLTIIKSIKQYQANLTSEQLEQLNQLLPMLNVTEQAELKILLDKLITTEIETLNDHSLLQNITQTHIPALLNKATNSYGNNQSADNRCKQWINYLRGYTENNNQPIKLEPLKGDYSQALKHDFPLFQSALELATAFNQKRESFHVSPLEYETFLEAILRFRDQIDDQIRALINPILDRIDEVAGQNYYLDTVQFGIHCLAKIWSEKGDIPPIDVIKSGYGSSLNNIIWARRLQNGVNWLQKGIYAVPLSLPTNRIGWLDPVVFADRFNGINSVDIDQLDLSIALYRLVNDPVHRVQAWLMIADRVKDKANSIEQAVCLALGDDQTAHSALQWFNKYFQHNPPTLFAFQTRQLSSDGCEQAIKNYFTPENLTFQLFYAALIARYGLSDLRQLTNQIPTDKITIDPKDLMYSPYRTTPDTNLVSPEMQLYQSVVSRYLFNLKPIEAALTKDHKFQHYSYRYGEITTILLPLQPYYLFITSIYQYCFYNCSIDLFPIMAQRYFEIGVAVVAWIEKIRFVETHNIIPMIEMGNLPFVEVSEQSLSIIARLFTFKDKKVQEKILNLLLIWLQDGRCTPLQIATAIANTWRNADKGAKYIVDALTSLGVAHRAGNLLSLLVIEQLLATDADNVPMKNLSMAMKKLEELATNVGMIRNKDAISALERLAVSKKTSPVKNIAKHLLPRVTDNVTQIEIEIVAILLEMKIDSRIEDKNKSERDVRAPSL